jgi:hypothetical protein
MSPHLEAERSSRRGCREENRNGLNSPLLIPEEAFEDFSRPVSWLGAYDLPAFPSLFKDSDSEEKNSAPHSGGSAYRLPDLKEDGMFGAPTRAFRSIRASHQILTGFPNTLSYVA